MSDIQLSEIITSFETIQDNICRSMEALDGSRFKEDKWERPGGGGGRTRVLNGGIIEKGGVNFSHVFGQLSNKMADTLKVDRGIRFDATGVSIVMHPSHPHIPIIHMNIRYFNLDNQDWWFGGGIDLTPIYVVEDDARFCHQQLKNTCDKFDAAYYPKFKEWADRYFYLPHRKEARGIGGIFFDHIGRGESDRQPFFDFTKAVGETFIPIYSELINRNKNRSFSDQEKDWQLLRRSRYVEFNLIWDRGTKFGIETDGRTESILMSMPPMAKWVYNHAPEKGSEEKRTLDVLAKVREWV